MIYVANYAFSSDLEAEQDDPSVRDMDLTDLAQPVVAAAGTVLVDVITQTKAEAEEEFRGLVDTTDVTIVWLPPEGMITKGAMTTNSDSETYDCVIVVREMKKELE